MTRWRAPSNVDDLRLPHNAGLWLPAPSGGERRRHVVRCTSRREWRATLGVMAAPEGGSMAMTVDRLAGTSSGTNGFRLMPTDDFHEAPAAAHLTMTAGGQDLLFTYTWAHPADGPQDGVLLVGSPELGAARRDRCLGRQLAPEDRDAHVARHAHRRWPRTVR